MRTLLAAVCSISVLCTAEPNTAQCETDALLQQLSGIRTQLERNFESEARKQFKHVARQAAPCAQEVRAGNTLADLAIRLHQPKDALKCGIL